LSGSNNDYSIQLLVIYLNGKSIKNITD